MALMKDVFVWSLTRSKLVMAANLKSLVEGNSAEIALWTGLWGVLLITD